MSNNDILVPKQGEFTPKFFVGRPRKFTEKELRERIGRYFNEYPREEWRITGLAIVLSISRQTIYEWIDEKREFSDIIRAAVNMIEDKYAHNCEKRGNAGDIFILKNMKWSDKQEIDMNISGSLSLSQLAAQADQDKPEDKNG